MGNSCTTCCDTNREVGGSLAGASGDKPKLAQNLQDPANNTGSNEHAPVSDDIILKKMTEMNRVNANVLDAMNKNGPFNPNYKIRDSWRDLPELGPYAYPNGSTYVGQYKYGVRHGEGKMIGSDGSVYEGQWSGDKRNGEGRFIHSDGDCYIGEWVNDKMEVTVFLIQDFKKNYHF